MSTYKSPNSVIVTRRRFLTLIAGGTIPLFVAACAQPPTPGAPGSASKPAPSGPPATAAPASKPATASDGAASAPKPASAATTGGTPKRGGTWKAVIPGEAPHYDILQYQGPGQEPLHVCYSNLVTIDQHLKDGKEFAPDLAESWTLSQDNLTWTFKLQQGVKWHDGVPFTSADVKASIERAKTPPQGTINPNSGLFAPVEEIATPDDHTVVFRTKFPYRALLDALNFPVHKIVPKHILDQQGDMKKVVVGTGAFKWAGYVPGSHYEVVRNQDYFRSGRPYVDTLKFMIIPDDDARFNAFRTHQVHHVLSNADISIPQLNIIESTLPKVHVQPLQPTSLTTIFFNLDKEPWNDVRVRKAIFLALDRQGQIEVVSQGKDLYGGLVSPGTPYSVPEDIEALKQLPGFRQPKDQDIAEAKRLMAEAGSANGFSTTMLVRNLSKLVNLAQWVRSELQKIGIRVELKVEEDAVGQTSFNNGKYELFASGWNTSLAQPEGYISALMRRDLRKWPKFSAEHPELEQLAQRVEQTGSVEERRKGVLDLQKAVFDVVPHVPSAWVYKFNVMWDDLKGFSGPPGIGMYSNYWDVCLDES